MKPLIFALMAILPIFTSCQSNKKQTMPQQLTSMMTPPANAETATFGGGCYWCLEAAFRQLDGVCSVTSGFMGGTLANPTYKQVCEGDTGHAEVVQVVFDPQKTSYAQLLDWFWKLHDPTTLNRQGADEGTQYRSVIFYHSEAQKKQAEASKLAIGAHHSAPIVTEVTAASAFYPAPQDHQDDYYFRNKSKNPYCRIVIEPKLKKVGLNH